MKPAAQRKVAPAPVPDLPGGRLANAPRVHLSLEPFEELAFNELAAAPLWEPGRCFNPGCARRFNPSRSWQRYCGQECAKVGERELTRVGLRAALPLLAWRLHKYAAPGTPEGDLGKAARRHITRLQSEWVADRRARAELARAGGA